jgi:hypothetical protein
MHQVDISVYVENVDLISLRIIIIIIITITIIIITTTTTIVYTEQVGLGVTFGSGGGRLESRPDYWLF